MDDVIFGSQGCEKELVKVFVRPPKLPFCTLVLCEEIKMKLNSSKENIFLIIDLYYSLNNNNIPPIITGFIFGLPKNMHFSDWLIS